MAIIDRRIDNPDAMPPDTNDRERVSRIRWLSAAAAVVLVTAGIAGALTLSQSDQGTTAPPNAVRLSVPGGTPSSTSCVPFDVSFLRDMPVAFAGTVTSLTDEQVVLDVDRWYNGTTAQKRADVVTLTLPDATSSVALDGVEFSDGNEYLLAATNGEVIGCGFSGPATSELEAAYVEAFGS